ncbi:PqqD family protein [Terrabacter carboxydivorans]|uniref:Coenzyme PQQ synthesis protein D (PqqD) n=1 Tax=Terrabacter carboxydivorans TaxID=619730 RepID=A0ABP5Z989_9MICO
MSAAYRPGPDAGVTLSEDGQTVYVAHLPGGPLVVLEGAAAVIWVEATTAPGDGWVSRVADAFGRPEDAIASDVETFVDDLRARRLLVTDDSPRD